MVCLRSIVKRVLALEEENAKPPVKLDAASDSTGGDSSVPRINEPGFSQCLARNPGKIVLGPKPEPAAPAPHIRHGDLWSHPLPFTNFLVLCQ